MSHSEASPYYFAYEARYRAAYAAGADHWGHTPDDTELREALTAWVQDNNLCGKRVIEFACGEGAGGVILSELGCIYTGIDVSPTAVSAAKNALRDVPGATVLCLDMTKTLPQGVFDAAFDSMGFHMLVTDTDRAAYLKNAAAVLRSGAPMLFYKEAYRNEKNTVKTISGPVPSFDVWLSLTHADYITPECRTVLTKAGDEINVMVPLVPARANDEAGYIAEMKAAGFTVERFCEMNISDAIAYAASIYVRKPVI